MRYTLLLLVLTVGCDTVTHTPRGENIVEIRPPGENALQIDLTSAEDTLLVWGEVDLGYRISDNRIPTQVSLLLDDRTVASGRDGVASFSTFQVEDGTYRLRLIATAPSGTGSLGDRLGRETITTITERVAIVENRPPEAPELSSRVENGLLTLAWTAATTRRFSRYVITGGPIGGSQSRRIEIENREQTHWADSTFLGGGASYKIETIVGEPQPQSAQDVLNVEGPVPSFNAVELIANGQVQLEWNETLYTGALSRYIIRRELSIRPGERQTAFATASATSFVDQVSNLPLGTSARYELLLEGLNGSIARLGPTQSVTSQLEDGLPFTPQAYISNGPAWLGVDLGGSALYRWTEDGTIQSVGLPPFASSVPRAVASVSGLRLVTAGGLFAREHDLETLAITRTVALSAPAEGDARIGAPMTLSDDGLLVFGYERLRSFGIQNGIGAGVLHLGTEAFEGRIEPQRDTGHAAGVTADGRFILVLANSQWLIYEREAPEQFTLRGNVQADAAVLLPGSNELAVREGSTVSILSLPSLAVVRTFEVAANLGELRYDPGLNALYGHDDFSDDSPTTTATVFAYDVETGTERGRLRIARDAVDINGIGGPYIVLGGRLWWRGLTRDLLTSSTAQL